MKIAQTRKLHAAGILPKPPATDNIEALSLDPKFYAVAEPELLRTKGVRVFLLG